MMPSTPTADLHGVLLGVGLLVLAVLVATAVEFAPSYWPIYSSTTTVRIRVASLKRATTAECRRRAWLCLDQFDGAIFVIGN